MISRIHYIFCLLFLLLFFNCATYWENRRKDFQDIFTIGFEKPGVGLGARLGPLNFGLFFQGGETSPGKADKGVGIGLRGGSFGKYKTNQMSFFLMGGESFYKIETPTAVTDATELTKQGIPVLQNERDNLKSHKVRYLSFYHDPPRARKKRRWDSARREFVEDLVEKNNDPRLKNYIPAKEAKPFGYSASYLFQIEVFIAAYGGIRLGFNPAEFLDFLLGFFTIDIFGDDLPEEKGDDPPLENETTDTEKDTGGDEVKSK